MKIHVADVMGGDLSVVNAARASFAKRAVEMTPADVGLVRFLARNDHMSPFGHAAIRFDLTSTLRQRITWETGQSSQAGQIFSPSLDELTGQLQDGKDALMTDPVSWRWTASLEALARWILDSRTTGREAVANVAGQYFPVSMEALTGANPPRMTADPPMKPDVAAIPVLGAGYARLVQWMGGPTDAECLATFEVKAPLVVRSQWFKYTRDGEQTPPMFIWHPDEPVGSGNGDDGGFKDPMYRRNEASGRYIDLEEYYVPARDAWRGAPASRKQGSRGLVAPAVGDQLTDHLMATKVMTRAAYEGALARGVAPEQARLFLPRDAKFTYWHWTTSIAGLKHFLRQRLDSHAQAEIQQYARAIYDLAKVAFPDLEPVA